LTFGFKLLIADYPLSVFSVTTIILRNTTKTPFPKGSTPDSLTTGRIRAFRVTKPLNANCPQTTLPASLRPPITPLQTYLPPRKLMHFEGEDEFDRLKTMLGTIEQGAMDFEAPITENPKLNDSEIWEFYNETVHAHTIHLHLVHMQLISRQKFNVAVDEETGKLTNIRLLGNPTFPVRMKQAGRIPTSCIPAKLPVSLLHLTAPASMSGIVTSFRMKIMK
jgi:spore coat protein A